MLSLLYFIYVLLTLTSVECIPGWEELEQNLTKYNYDLPPWTETGNRTEVKTKLLLTNLRSTLITELDMTFNLIQEWQDDRLIYESNSIKLNFVLLDLDKYVTIWTPDSYISNALSETQHSVTKPNVFIRIYPNGKLIKSTRITVKVSCPVTSNGFPRGTEVCSFHIKSFSYSRREVALVWSPVNPVAKSDEFSAPGVEVPTIQAKECSNKGSMEDEPCLEVSTTLVRDYGIYIIRIYVPSGFLVALGWLSMWIDKGQVGARTSLGVLCVLSLITQTLGIISMGNGLDGVIAIDIWLAVCMLFTIIALAVFASVHNIKRRKDKSKATAAKYKNPDPEDDATEDNSCTVTHGCLQNIFRVVYPLLFIIFNVVYWIYFLRE